MKFRIVKIFEDGKWVYRVDQWQRGLFFGGDWSGRGQFHNTSYGWEYRRYKTAEAAEAEIKEYMKDFPVIKEIVY